MELVLISRAAMITIRVLTIIAPHTAMETGTTTVMADTTETTITEMDIPQDITEITISLARILRLIAAMATAVPLMNASTGNA